MVELKRLKLSGVDRVLRIDKLQLVAFPEAQQSAGLGADADPVEARRDGARTVRLNGDLEAEQMKGVDEGCIDLQQRVSQTITNATTPNVEVGGSGVLYGGPADANRSPEAS